MEDKTRHLVDQFSQLLQLDVKASTEELETLEKMNNVITERYMQMTGAVSEINDNMSRAKQVYKDLTPYLQQIDELDSNLNALEQVVQLLDEVTRRLEIKTREVKLI
eukprot:GILK01011851.1.p1 GENE.GILK01011851.1~~GILK01011851.1.p1  ORF type:complete len:107 (+),score=17.09 GILK01011851.1:45-365(+)